MSTNLHWNCSQVIPSCVKLGVKARHHTGDQSSAHLRVGTQTIFRAQQMSPNVHNSLLAFFFEVLSVHPTDGCLALGPEENIQEVQISLPTYLSYLLWVSWILTEEHWTMPRETCWALLGEEGIWWAWSSRDDNVPCRRHKSESRRQLGLNQMQRLSGPLFCKRFRISQNSGDPIIIKKASQCTCLNKTDSTRILSFKH